MRFAGMALQGSNYIDAARSAGQSMDAILAKQSPDYAMTSSQAMDNRANENISAINAQANVTNAGINSLASAKAGAYGAQATIAQGKAAADATRAQGMSSMIGDIGGGLLGAFKPKTQTTAFGSLGPSNFNLNGYSNAFTPGGTLSRSQQGW